MHDITATYSPEDNKTRLYPDSRLDTETFQRVKAAGYKWAPKQELFVAPMWTPAREDIAVDLAGEIGDEDTSLVGRAEERAGRFEEYSDKRAADAMSAKDAVSAITENIPFGQPILCGHHSEKKARKHAEQIENGMRKAVKMWETSKYWTERAAGAIHHAKYLEKPQVRARRIKKIEAAKRKELKTIKHAEKCVRHWENIDNDSILKRKDGKPMTAWDRARIITNYLDHISCKFPLDTYPREEPASQYEGSMSLWSALDGIISAEQARDIAMSVHRRAVTYSKRWVSHCDNRLLYEKAMLEAQGGSDLLKPKARPKQLPLLNYKAPEGLSVENMYQRGEFELYPQVEMTKAEYKAIYEGSRGTHTIENSHRVRAVYRSGGGEYSRSVVFLTDSKVHKKPEPVVLQQTVPETPRLSASRPTYTPPERTEFDDMKDSLKEGVKTVSAPQLFPTPPEIAKKMVEYANLEQYLSICEPSAGTGSIVKAIGQRKGRKVSVEINHTLSELLKTNYPEWKTYTGDFLTDCNPDCLGTFDRIIMNPPFKNGEDIKHIKHALTFLAPGGRLVALCANGPRQQVALKPIAESWEDLPQGSFKNQGTNVNTAMVIVTK